MSGEAAAYIDKAERSLSNARKILGAGVNEDAGRAAYIAGLNAAQGYIFAKTARIAKTHNGVAAKFYELTKDLNLDPDIQRFLSRAYRLKEIADYEVGNTAVLPSHYAEDAIKTAESFIGCVKALLGGQ